MARKKSAEVPKAVEPAMIKEVQPRAEEGLVDALSRVLKLAGADITFHRDAQSGEVSEEASFEAFLNERNASSDLLGEIDINDFPLIPSFSEGQIEEAQSIGPLDAGTIHGGEDLFRGCFTGVEDAPDLDVPSIFNEAHRLLSQASLRSLYQYHFSFINIIFV